VYITTQQARALNPETSRSIRLMPLPIASACRLIDVRPGASAEIYGHLNSILDHGDICLFGAPLSVSACRSSGDAGDACSVLIGLLLLTCPYRTSCLIATYSAGASADPPAIPTMVWRHGVSQIWHLVKCLLSDEWRLLHSPRGGIRPRRTRVHNS